MTGWRMPPEWAPQERVWMAFPTDGYVLGDTDATAERARSAWAAVAEAVAAFEPVTMVVDPADVAHARRVLPAAVDIVTTPLDDAWLRDTGPTFVLDDAHPTRLGAVDWRFNGWGGQDWATWEKDRHVASFVGGEAGAEAVASPLVNEGGGFHVDGEGTALATRSVQLDPGRNPGLTEADVEAEFHRVLGVEKVIWLDRGLTRDSAALGTRGHVDLVATFAAPGVVLVHDQRHPDHPDHAVSQEVLETLSGATDAAERPLRVVPVAAPPVLRDDEGWVDHSYINHLVVNGGVIACGFAEPGDEDAATADRGASEVLARAYPGRRVVTVPAAEIFAAGGGIHCITQQQPRRGRETGRNP